MKTEKLISAAFHYNLILIPCGDEIEIRPGGPPPPHRLIEAIKLHSVDIIAALTSRRRPEFSGVTHSNYQEVGYAG